MSPQLSLTTDEHIQRAPGCAGAARTRGVTTLSLVLALAGLGCDRSPKLAPERQDVPATNASGVSGARPAASVETVSAPLRAQMARSDLGADAGAPPVVRVNELEAAPPPDACPATMAYVRGGEFWMGSAAGRGARDERPRFLTRVADYCIDTYEVTSASYEHCVKLGACSEPRGEQSTCNYRRREDHPINCVDWAQADAYCRSQGARLPSELEWEYAARGGRHYYPFSWGYDAADDRTCWKTNKTCPVGSYAPGAFGLHDISGNVWEWTNDWFGEYPWPKPSGRAKVFRGGGWTRGIDRWLSATLRNRTSPDRFGSYLGFRCAQLAKGAECPFGPGDEPGLCRHGVLNVDCANDERFNGQRCVERGAPLCGPYQDPISGHGCVRRASELGLDDADAGLPEEAPTRLRTPEHDADCQRNQPRRPSAYVIRGGSHLDRNRYAKEERCRNRDVGVGWNSVCCRQ